MSAAGEEEAGMAAVTAKRTLKGKKTVDPKPKGTKRNTRPDHDGSHRAAFDKNKKKILASQDICGICGKPVDKTIKPPHPMSPTIDHIIPVSKGGHPSDIDNLQLAHRCCNRAKSDKIVNQKYSKEELKDEVISNRVLPLSMDWTKYKANEAGKKKRAAAV